jgi:hypothetical protein
LVTRVRLIGDREPDDLCRVACPLRRVVADRVGRLVFTAGRRTVLVARVRPETAGDRRTDERPELRVTEDRDGVCPTRERDDLGEVPLRDIRDWNDRLPEREAGERETLDRLLGAAERPRAFDRARLLPAERDPPLCDLALRDPRDFPAWAALGPTKATVATRTAIHRCLRLRCRFANIVKPPSNRDARPYRLTRPYRCHGLITSLC